jgi:hypothetical protein
LRAHRCICCTTTQHNVQNTQVDPKRQKLLGLKTKDGKAATDEAVIADLAIKPNAKIMMMGQTEDVIAQAEAEQLAAPEVQVRVVCLRAGWCLVCSRLHLHMQ